VAIVLVVNAPGAARAGRSTGATSASGSTHADCSSAPAHPVGTGHTGRAAGPARAHAVRTCHTGGATRAAHATGPRRAGRTRRSSRARGNLARRDAGADDLVQVRLQGQLVLRRLDDLVAADAALERRALRIQRRLQVRADAEARDAQSAAHLVQRRIAIAHEAQRAVRRRRAAAQRDEVAPENAHRAEPAAVVIQHRAVQHSRIARPGDRSLPGDVPALRDRRAAIREKDVRFLRPHVQRRRVVLGPLRPDRFDARTGRQVERRQIQPRRAQRGIQRHRVAHDVAVARAIRERRRLGDDVR